MPSQSSAFEQLMDRALTSLASWQVLETLAATYGAPIAPHVLVTTTGLDIDDIEQAVVTLAHAHLVGVSAKGVMLEPGQAPAVIAFCAQVQADFGLYRDVLKRAIRSEGSVPSRSVKIAWAPNAVRELPASPSLTVCVPGVPGPTQSADRTAPAA